MEHTPAKKITDILLPAYHPCSGFEGACKGVATWHPHKGHVPRGFVGATSSLQEVEVVLLVAEPGDPYDPLPAEAGRLDLLNRSCLDTFEHLRDGKDLFHRNLRKVLSLIFPGLEFAGQLKKAWITETYLCSAPQETGPVRSQSERWCARQYLAKQVALFDGRPIIALGRKAQQRAKPYAPNLIEAYAIAPPGCNRKAALPSWEAAATRARQMIAARKQSLTVP